MTAEKPVPTGTAGGPEEALAALVGERLTLVAFHQLARNLAGYPFVKLVVDRPRSTIHFINGHVHAFHADYIAEQLMGVPRSKIEEDIDAFNHSVYRDPERDYFLAILALHKRADRMFFSLETVEVDTMDSGMIQYLYRVVREFVDHGIPVLVKPANHGQETSLAEVDSAWLPRVHAHELFSSATYIPLNTGHCEGRLRLFATEAAYREARGTLEWHDIIVMERVPDDIPRLAGIVNSCHTTPLSHTNVLASGWQVPNSIQLGALEDLTRTGMDGKWVRYEVAQQATQAKFEPIDRPSRADQKPAWRVQKVQIDEPHVADTPIVQLSELRHSDRYKYGTKAANLGELHHVLEHGSERLVGFYRVRRPPRPNLLAYLADLLGVPEDDALDERAWEMLKATVRVPHGIAIPFSVQQEFLESSPKIQQAIGKLKMALELGARQIDSLCVALQQLIRQTRLPEDLQRKIDACIARELSGISSFVVRSSSNAEDLQQFSAAGIYESINHVTSAQKLFESIKQVWASLLSPRSVRLRQEVGISLDDCYMGVIVQEEMPVSMGGVMVTTNPMNRNDFRNVYFNISGQSIQQVVQGSDLPYQSLFNTVEGGGRTLSIGAATSDLADEAKALLGRLALCGRLLQSHFSPDYTYSAPIDVEWLATDDQIYIVQLRPYA